MSTERARGPARRGFSWQWLGYLTLGGAASAAFLADRHGALAQVLYPGIAASALVAVLIGLRRQRPPAALPWVLLGLGAAMCPAISISYVVFGGGDAVDAAVVTSVSTALALLVLLRLAGVARDAQRKARQLDRQAVALKAALEEQVALQRQLTNRAFHDPLTDLPNRALLNERLSHAVSRRGAVARTVLMMLDLDGFKAVNDTLGHPCGDQLLIEVAHRLVAVVRRADTVARLGGDEFAVLLEDASPAAALSIAGRVVDAVRQPLVLQGRELHVTVSVGVLLSCEGVTPGEAVRDADVALYYAKSAGRNQIQVFEPSMRAAAIHRATLESELRAALAREQFCLHYQPIYDLVRGSLVEVEALLRWDHPTRGLLPPGQFIPLAEETGLILSIGQWVLVTACRQLRQWRDGHPSTDPFRMSVNLSGRQLREPNLADAVAQALAAAGLSPDALTLEIPESVLMSNIDAVVETAAKLRQLGVRIAIDDFGTGYSSLSCLRQLPVDLVKIDRSFMRDAHAPEEEWALTRGIIRLSESMHLPTIAEGVETAEQAARLTELHCQLGQGYYFAPPLTADVVDGLLSGQVPAVSETMP